MKKLVLFLSSMKMTILGGVALVPSLFFYLANKHIVFDTAWITAVICGIPILYSAWHELKDNHAISSELLVSLALFACIWTGQLFAAGEVAFIMSLGGLLETYSANRARKGIKTLISLVPQQGRRISNDKEEIVKVEDIKKGDIIRVLPGERIPLDGEILLGNTSVDQSIMTGESLPVDKTKGDVVFSGTMNLYGSVDIRVIKIGHDTSLQKMVALIKEAEETHTPMQRIVDKWAKWLVLIMVVVTILTYLFTGDFIRAVTVMVVFCPCAFVLATPISIIAGMGQATKFGVLIKSGVALESMGKVNCIAFDKTGTLTKGQLSVSDIVVADSGYTKEQLLQLTASVELRSEHPLGKTIVERSKAENQKLLPANNFHMIPGKGVLAEVNGQTIICGNAQWLKEYSIEISEDMAVVLDRLRQKGKALVLTAVGGQCTGIIALSDTIRENACEMIDELKKMGVKVVVLTGDHPQAAKYLAEKIGVEDVRAELMPEDKVKEIDRIKQGGQIVCMIGDGVNDAPALKTANVGVAMEGIGCDIAIETADIALVGDNIAKIPYLKRLSNAVRKSIIVNISLSMVINVIAIILSIFGLLNPVTGALVHNAGSVIVVLNAALLYDRKI